MFGYLGVILEVKLTLKTAKFLGVKSMFSNPRLPKVQTTSSLNFLGKLIEGRIG